MSGRSRDVGAAIVEVAAAADDPQAFTARACAVAEAFGPRVIGKSKIYLLAPPSKPAELAGRHEGLGDWMWTCQAAIFEIWFHLGADALRDLREVTFGVYDWTQAHATQALCRLALKGVDQEGTAALIAAALPDWRTEQVMRVCGDVAALAARVPVLRKAYDRLVDEYLRGDPVDAYDLIAADARADPDHARERYLPFLRGLMAGKGLEGRTARNPDDHQVRAAVLLRELDRDDADAKARLEAWATGHPDENVRGELQGLLAAGPTAPAT